MSQVLTIPCVVHDAEDDPPQYAKPGDAGLDLRSRINAVVPAAGGRLVIPTGISVAIPTGFAGLVLPRSGTALRNGVTCMNSPGLIDSGYRGELQVILLNTDPAEDFLVQTGDRIAQLVVVAVPTVEMVQVTELDPTERGEGGFGHTGR